MIKCKLNILLAMRDIRQSDLIRDTGIQAMTISKAARNQLKQIPIDTANTLCKYFNCKLDDIWQYTPDQDTDKS